MKCVLQFIADAKLLYDLDTSGMGEKLLRIYDRVVKEANTRCKEYDTIMETHKRRVEDLAGEALNGDWTDQLFCQFPVTRFKLVSWYCSIFNTGSKLFWKSNHMVFLKCIQIWLVLQVYENSGHSYCLE